MKRLSGLGPLVLLLLVASVAAPSRAPAAESAAAVSSNTARADQLARDVREFATAPGLSRAKREKRIATAVRTAVVAATAYRSDSAAALGAASELAAAAAHAAPAYVEVIAKAAALAPGVARIDGSAGAIRSAAVAGIKNGRTPPRVATSKGHAPAARKTAAAHKAPVETVEPEPVAPEAAEAATAQVDSEGRAPSAMEEEMPVPEPAGRHGRNPVEDPAFAISATLTAGARYDDNVFLQPDNQVSDTILSAVPGVSLRWGDKAHTHGSLGYAETFDHYIHGTSPNVSLGNAAFNFAFDGAASSGSANASYAQLYQTNTDLAAQGINSLIRTDVSAADIGVEANPWAKIGGRLRVTYAKTSYRTGGLIGNDQIGVPFNLIFNVTPKTDLTLGYTFGTQRPEGDGEASKDHYLNVGARGEFTAKLSGSFNVGYQTRQVGANPDEHMLAFNGTFDYAMTARTTLSFNASRDFNASALGASTKDTTFRLSLATDFSPQFSLKATVAYLNNEYGAPVFRPDQVNPGERTDRTWEGTLTASYAFTEWFSTTASYFLRNNDSTTPSVDFNSNVFSLSLGLKY